MSELHQLVTLKGLNTVYKDVRKRISQLGAIYHVKGNLEWKDLIDATSTLYTAKNDDGTTGVKEGDVYNLVGIPEDIIENKSTYPDLYNNVNIIALQNITSTTDDIGVTDKNFRKYWNILGSVFDEATDTIPGVIKTGSTLDTEESEVESSTETIKRGLKLNDSSDSDSYGEEGEVQNCSHQAYIDIPIASETTYGVLNTTSQTLQGNKTLKGSLTVDSLEVGNETVIMNKLNTNTLVLGGITITANNGVLTFSTI